MMRPANICSRRSNPGLTVSVSTLSDLEAAQSQLQEQPKPVTSLGFLVSDPSVIRDHASHLQRVLSSLKDLQELRLAVRGMGKKLGRQDPDEIVANNTIAADTVADILLALPASITSISLELGVSKLGGSLRRLCEAVIATTALTRVVIHECHNDEDESHQGILPLLQALGHCTRLETVTVEAVQFPVGDITAQALVNLVASPALTRLEFQHCVDLGDDELVPLLEQLPLTKLQHLKLSTGFSMKQPHPGRQWGARAVETVARALTNPKCTLTSLSLINSSETVNLQASLMPIVHAMAQNTRLTRLHLYQTSNSNSNNSRTDPALAPEMVRILSTNQNMTLQHCNSLQGASREDFAALHFYTRLNLLNRQELLQEFATNNNDNDNNSKWTTTLLDHAPDHRIVHYLLMNNPSLLPSL